VKDNNGNNVATVGVARDITERKFAEDALKQSEEKYRSLVENLSVGVFQNSLDGSILQANPAFVKIFEFNSIDEILKTNVSDLYQNKEDRRIFLDELNKYGFVHNKELKLKKKDGSLIWASVSARAFLNDKKEIIWYNGVIDDITSIKKANQALIEAKDKAEESERIKSNFLANMSHELRTPMVGILGYSEFLRENSKDQEIKLMADTINKSGTRLLETLNLILDLSRLEQDKVDLNFEKTNIVNIARDVLNLFQVSAKSKNIKLELECSLENIFAYIDQRILHQILNNLINNAIKFTDSGSVTVMISEEIKSGKDWSVIKVKDTGIGIPKDKQNIIFEEFRQVSEGFNRSFEGTGLGLTITKNFVEAMKGEIKVESKIGEGSTFTVSFPSGKTSLAKSDDKEISSGKSGNKIMSRENYNVLCVDDEVTSNKLVKAILNKICNVDFAFEGKSALELLGLKKYDTILMDINLGTGMSGIEVIKKIKKIPAYIKTPIIALTAFAMRGDKEEFLSMGCDYYLSKPYTQNELREIVIEAIEKGNK
jgi:PAS domain S-box-containing protein